MNKGITLLAIGSEGYMLWAVNMACCIKHYSPQLPVQLVASRSIIDKIKACRFELVFDYFTEMVEEDYTAQGQFSPGKAKLSLPGYFIFERTIYLDVDGCVIKDLTPLFDLPGHFIAQLEGSYKPGSDEHPEAMVWCKSSVLMQHYNLAHDVTIPALNSSFLLLDDVPEVQQLFKKAHDNLSLYPIPAALRSARWGYGQGLQPDELYLNVACAQLGMYPLDVQAVYFKARRLHGKVPEINEIRNSFYGIGLYGNEDFNHPQLKSVYDRCVRPLFYSFFPKHHFSKAEYLMKYKIVNQKFA